MNTTEIAVELLGGGQSTEIALTTASAQGPVVTLPTNHPPGVPVKCLLSVDATCYGRKGTNPTAVAATDQRFPAGTYRIELMVGERIALIMATGTGSANFTPSA